MIRPHNRDVYQTSEFMQWGKTVVEMGLSHEESTLLSALPHCNVILEIGCGGGRIVKALHQLGHETVIGMDIILDFAKLIQPITPMVINADAARPPLTPETVDHVIALANLICFLESRNNRMQFLTECYRIMRKQSFLILSALDFERMSYVRRGIFYILSIFRKLPLYNVKEAQLFPWLRRGGKPNLRFFFPNEPLVYWYRANEFQHDIEAAGFIIRKFLRCNGELFVVAEKL